MGGSESGFFIFIYIYIFFFLQENIFGNDITMTLIETECLLMFLNVPPLSDVCNLFTAGGHSTAVYRLYTASNKHW